MDDTNSAAPLPSYLYRCHVPAAGKFGLALDCRDGSVRVSLDGEGDRFDQWHPSQVVRTAEVVS